MSEHPKREFFVIGKEAQLFTEIIKGKWYENIETAKLNRSTKDAINGIYRITVEFEGYFLNGEWVGLNERTKMEYHLG